MEFLRMTMRRITKNRLVRPSAVLVALVLIVGATTGLRAQTGKISTKVTDAKTGEVLLKATVMVLETHQGALTKDNGVATIINIAPSENYTVVAKYQGMTPDTIRHVKVQSD